MDLKTQAETLRCELLAGCTTVAEAVAWADAVIATEAAPPATVVDVSLSGTRPPAEVAALLAAVPGHVNGTEVRRQLMARMDHLVEEDPSRGEAVAKWLFALATSGELPQSEFGWAPYGLDDAFVLARNGVVGTHADALAQLRTYLRHHSSPRAP